MNIDPPVVLPVNHLSVSSIRLFLQCQERWRRRYLLGEYEPTSPAALLGTAVHKAEGDAYQHRIDQGALRPVRDVLDTFSDEYDLEVERAADRGIDWEDEKPGRVKDTGVRVVRHYHQSVAPHVKPVTVERKYSIGFDGLAWTFDGFIDLEEERGTMPQLVAGETDLFRPVPAIAVADMKVRSPTKGAVSAVDAASDLQVTGNLFARRAEGEPAERFAFHNMVRPRSRSTQLTPKHVVVTPAHRTQQQLDDFLELIMRVAAQIVRCAETDTWMPAPPGAWWCAQRWCGFWETCAYGGQHRSQLFRELPQPVRRPTASLAKEALLATARKDGTTTAARVASHMGIPVRQAAGLLAAAPGVESSQPLKGRGKDKKPTSGPRVYKLAVAADESSEAIAA